MAMGFILFVGVILCLIYLANRKGKGRDSSADTGSYAGDSGSWSVGADCSSDSGGGSCGDGGGGDGGGGD
ncbi:hypothetical protein J5J83_10270 [Azoarcus sp. L1K30]|uniref:hypothetical protein n=1 Tax=Azoarcus sp. L1K30 TaxID=2820277 RepID=UPI001B8108BF|nr:hypothetical protein [Azoarcus sp. L1K30]MBR0566500.1 hypothetical protein [Azoarcus sp. L1K30]